MDHPVVILIDSPCIVSGEESLDGGSDPLGAGGAISARLVRAADEQSGAGASDSVRPVMIFEINFIRIRGRVRSLKLGKVWGLGFCTADS